MYGDDSDNEEDQAQLEFDKKNDHLNYENDPAIKKIIGTEKFLFSDIVTKKNKFGFNQSRNFVLTDTALYNLKEKKEQRKFEISRLKGITVSIAKGCNEFVIHGESEYDYLYTSKYKYTIIWLIEAAFEKLCGKELGFIFTDQTSLKNRMTTKAEKKADPHYSRMDDSQLSDIKQFFKNLYYDENEELVYIEEEEANTLLEGNAKNPPITPFIKQSKSNKVIRSQNVGSSSLQFSRQSRSTLSASYINAYAAESNAIKNEVEGGDMDMDEDMLDFEGEDAMPLKPAKIEDFIFICCIGKGRNSTTYIAKNKNYGVFYAVKASDKEKLLLNKNVDNLKIEKKILTSLFMVMNNKCVVQLINCFQTFDKIFFSYPFYRGGDLLSFMDKNGGDFHAHPDLIFFYICELVSFLLKMHENKIIYRNLKPENIIIDDRGNLKMTDYSKSKIIAFDGDRGLSLVGAPEYMAPEIITGMGQRYEVDWWALGILIYQMLYGYTPFEDEYVDKIYQKILYTTVNFDSNVKIEPSLKDLITKLLNKDETKRLKDSDIKFHEYFKKGNNNKNVDWNKVDNYEIECPLKPNINEELQDDLQNFDKEFTVEKFNDREIRSGESFEFIKSAESFGIFDYFN